MKANSFTYNGYNDHFIKLKHYIIELEKEEGLCQQLTQQLHDAAKSLI